MKIYFHSIKITLYFNTIYFHYMIFFHDIKIYLYSMETNVYSIKYIFIVPPFLLTCKNV